ncbi:hypothetical protein [Marinigracilibium pacificum]|uniref:Uncharacterized protein n=1 Tax=Marinigracilibium pacificum TaxID=2729599 RepID=A0A848J1N3_9BACT|nr:hypothetical protein [Marinigracilibium pacificum]NMM49258.1 hypothetical protein [Marinigracilibium pacificum]
MKTTKYNPSVLEVDIAKAISQLKNDIAKMIDIKDEIHITENVEIDNPTVTLHITDNDGDKHDVVIKIIQRPDQRH